MTKLTKTIATLGFIALLSSTVTARTPQTQTPDNESDYNGHWWLRLTEQEKSSYLDGDSDCYVFELDRKIRYSRSPAEDSEYVTTYYFSNPDKRSVPVFEVIRLADDHPSLREIPKGGEVWNEPHWFYDGDWWNQSVPAERLSFIEGFLACYSRSPHPHAKFSKAPSQYVQLINRWYGTTSDIEEPNAKHINDKIADVLFRFQDHS
jgi:hypothetical protein